VAKNAPDQKEMMQPTNAQSGEPNYIDKSAQSVGLPAKYSDIAAPAYKTQNPRYWEYR
jgi:hypothetical protein